MTASKTFDEIKKSAKPIKHKSNMLLE